MRITFPFFSSVLLDFRSDIRSASTQSGNALMYVLLGVIALSGLAYTFSKGMTSQGTRKAESNQQALSQVDSQTCTLWVTRAVDNLKQRGCSQDDVSFELSNGHNNNPNAPVDESCHVFRENGAGMEPCGVYRDVTNCNLTVLALGEKCSNDDIIYAGDSGGNRIYTTAADQSVGIVWANGTTNTGVTSTSDGPGNTDTLVALADAGDPYEAADFCRALGPEWYLPSIDEMTDTFDPNHIIIGGFANGQHYWSSTEGSFVFAMKLQIGSGVLGAIKTTPIRLRCVRQD